MNGYVTVLEEYAQCEFTEKKSVFITYVKRVENEDGAKRFVSEIKEKHRDATHNVYAYILKDTGIARFSDDGEPSGTAGMPVLEVIKREGLTGVCVVVTRYFGGILLGAGGLVRAYAKAAKLGIDKAGTARFTEHTKFCVELSYGEYQKLANDAGKYGCTVIGTEYAQNVNVTLSCSEENLEKFKAYAADITAGKARIQILGKIFAPEV